jgi:hypothetical protein
MLMFQNPAMPILMTSRGPRSEWLLTPRHTQASNGGTVADDIIPKGRRLPGRIMEYGRPWYRELGLALELPQRMGATASFSTSERC